MHKNVDQQRDTTEQRKEMHRLIDRKRNKNESRKFQLSNYEKTDRRISYVYQRNDIQYRKINV